MSETATETAPAAKKSPRPLSRRRRLLFQVLSPLLVLLLRLYWKSIRVKLVIGEAQLDRLLDEGAPFIPCMWHRRQMLLAPYLLRRCAGRANLGFLVSPSRDGELGVMLLDRLGGIAVRGSATRTGAQAMRDLFLAVKQQRISPVMTPDGSTGPIYEFKPGPVMLSQLSRAPMLPISMAARRYKQFGSWDRFVLPWPFTSIAIAIGEPVVAPPARSFEDTAEPQRQMKLELDRLSVVAAEAIGARGVDGEG